MMYLGFFAAVFTVTLLILTALSEEESVADIADRRAVNKLADKSRQHKPRRTHKYTRAGIQ